MRRSLGVLLTILGACANASAAPAWKPTAPEGGTITALVRSPTDPAVVYAAGKGVWRSTDGGAHWSSYGGPPTFGSSIDDLGIGAAPAAPVYAMTISQLFRRTGNGPWQSLPVTGDRFVVDVVDRRRLLVTASSTTVANNQRCLSIQARLSSDGGTTWRDGGTFGTRCGAVNSFFELRVTLIAHPYVPGSAWAFVANTDTGDGTLWRTGDGGGTWTQEVLPPDVVAVGIPAPGNELIAVDPFFVSHRALSGGPWLDGPGDCELPFPESFVLVGRSDLVGCAGGLGPDFVSTAAFAPSVGAQPTLAGTYGASVFRDDGGLWEPSGTGIRDLGAQSVTRLGDGSLVMIADVGIFRSAGAGPWVPWDEGFAFSPGNTLGGLTPVAVDGTGAAVAVSPFGLVRRAPADVAWSLVPFPGGGPISVARARGAGRPLYVTTGTGVYASDDDGATWRDFHAFAPPVTVEPSESDPTVAFAVTAGALFRTTDRGATWQVVHGDTMRIAAVDPGDVRNVAAVRVIDNTLFVSRDRGTHWTARHVRAPDRGFLYVTDVAFDPASTAIMYAATNDDGIWATADDGSTWGPLGGRDFGQNVTSLLEERGGGGYGLLATLAGLRNGVAPVTDRVHVMTITGTATIHASRTGRLATCTGVTVTGGAAKVTWRVGVNVVGTGSPFRLPFSVVERKLTCEVGADTAFQHLVRRSPIVKPIGKPFPPGTPIVFANPRLLVGRKAFCVINWRGDPTFTRYIWHSGKALRRGQGNAYRPTRADIGRELTCKGIGRNRYGTTTSVTSPGVVVPNAAVTRLR